MFHAWLPGSSSPMRWAFVVYPDSHAFVTTIPSMKLETPLESYFRSVLWCYVGPLDRSYSLKLVDALPPYVLRRLQLICDLHRSLEAKFREVANAWGHLGSERHASESPSFWCWKFSCRNREVQNLNAYHLALLLTSSKAHAWLPWNRARDCSRRVGACCLEVIFAVDELDKCHK